MKTREKPQLRRSRLYYLKWILKLYSQHKMKVCIMLLLTLACTSIAVLFPIVLKYIVDNLASVLVQFQAGTLDLALAEQERNKMLMLIFLLGLGVFFEGYSPYYRGKVNIFFEMFFRDKYFADILKKGHRFFLKYRTGDLATRLTEDIRTWPPGLSWLCCSGIFRAVNSTSIIIFCFSAMLYLNWRLTLLACLPMPILAAIYMYLETSFQAAHKDLQEGMSETNDFLEAAYSGIKIIASFNASRPQIGLFNNLMKKRISQEMRSDTLWGTFAVFFEFLNYAGEILVLIFGGLMVIRGSLSLGGYYAFFSYLGMIIYPLMDIPMLFVTLSQACVSIDRLEDIEYSDAQTVEETEDGKAAVSEIEDISFDKVSFKYLDSSEKAAKEPFELKDLSFSIKKGTKTAIVGQIGSGKTTLINLVCALLRPDSGTIRINGTDIGDIAVRTFRDKLGYIQQEPVIFSASVAANIDFWRSTPEPLIESCAKLAQFDGEVLSFSGGYREEVGQRGITLSGGQRQRLSIARALAGKPQLLLMDDITASLDAENEKRLWNDLNSSCASMTCLIVTHRMSTAMMADNIIVMKDGQISAQGTHSELLETSDIYRELAKH